MGRNTAVFCAYGKVSSVLAGLVPAIHVFTLERQGVDARDKRGHDVENPSHGR
jgi:hypothetical protein